MTQAAPTMLRISGLSRSFGGIAAVQGVDISIRRGELTALIGPNGAGKSSLFNLVTGFERADAGRVEFADEDISGLRPDAIARRGLIRTFQLTKVFAALSVLENMLLARRDDPGDGLFGAVFAVRSWRRAERKARDEARAQLARFGLADKESEPAGGLSGGQRKLLELARASMLRPDMLLLDEPLAGVSPTLGREIITHIEEANAREGMTVLFIEHDLDVVMRHSRRVIVMAQGQVVADGPPGKVQQDARVLEAYLGSQRGGEAVRVD
jgi:branched-chain amino acid transport system ATP-binding protein